MPTKLEDLLIAKHVDLDVNARTKTEALGKIVDLVGDEIREPAKFLKEVLAREKSTSTFAEDGIAFPHARTDLVSKIVLGIGRSREGIPFGNNGEPAHLIFLIGVPQRLVNDYLVCVGTLARAAKDEARRAALLRAGTAEEFIAQLKQVESL